MSFLLPLWLRRTAAFGETLNGPSVRQELEEGPLKGLKASGGPQGKGEGALGSWIRREEVRRLIDDETGSHSDGS